MTDYEQFINEAKRLGAEFVGKIGDLDGKFYDAWRINGKGFILARNSTGRIGLYEFVGKDGAPVEEDIAWLAGKVGPERYYVDCPNQDCMWEGTAVIGTICPKCGTPTIAAQREA